MTVDVDAAARAVMAAQTPPSVEWDEASGWYRQQCVRAAEAVLALVAAEQTHLHAVVDAARNVVATMYSPNRAEHLRCLAALRTALAAAALDRIGANDE